jgi:hypothetical protein
MSSHATAHIQNFAEIGQGSTAAYEHCLLHRAGLADTDMEELKPLTRINIRSSAHRLKSRGRV